MRILVLTLLFSTAFTTLYAQNNVIVDSSLWQPNGPVDKLKVIGDTLVIAGDFDMVGPNTPYATSFDSSGVLIKDFPHTNGEVTKAIADDKNGVYIAGTFTKVGSQRRGGIAYIDSNNTVTSFFENQAIDGKVYDMEIKDSLLYVVGEITGVNKYTGGGAFIRTDTTLLSTSFPYIEGDVFASKPDGEGGVYIGGKFTHVGDYERANIAHIDKFGRVTPWNPGTDGEVRAIELDEEHIYIGGFFNYAGCFRRRSLAVFERNSNTPNTWDYTNFIDPGGIGVFVLLKYGGKVFVGTGNSLSGSGGSRNLFGIDRTNGNIAFQRTNVNSVYALAAGDGYVYVGGYIYGKTGRKLISIDTTKGLDKFTLLFNEIDGRVYALKYHKGILYVGGSHRNYQDIIAIEVNSQFKTYHSFKHKDNGAVYGLEIINDSILVAIGTIWATDDNQKNFRAFNINTFEKVNFQYQTIQLPQTISKIDDNNLFVGGYLRTISPGVTNSIAAINIKTSEQINWKFSFNSSISDIEIVDTNVYIAGGILAKLSTNSTNYTPWGPSNIYSVKSLAVKGDTLYVGGGFPKLGAFNFGYLGALNRFSGQVYPWDAKVMSNSNSGVFGLKIYKSKLFVNGGFIKIDTFTRYTIAAFDANTGVLLPFKADIRQQNVGAVMTFNIWNDILVCGGNTLNYFELPRRYVTFYDANTGEIINSSINTSLDVSTITSINDKLFLGGRFRISGGVVRRSIALINLKNGEAYPWKADINQRVFDFDIADGKIYYSGFFTEVDSQKRNYAAASYLSTGKLHHWDPNPNNYFAKLSVSNGKVYVGGPFTKIQDSTRKYFAAVDTGTAKPSLLHPFRNNKRSFLTKKLFSYKDRLFISGFFGDKDSIFVGGDTIIRPFLFSLNTKTDVVTDFDAKLPTQSYFAGIHHIFNVNDTVYFGGFFYDADTVKASGFIKAHIDSSQIDKTWFPNNNDFAVPIGFNSNNLYFALNKSLFNNRCRSFLSSMDVSTKKLTPWHPQIDIAPTTIDFANNKIYLGGEFTRFNNSERSFLTGVASQAISIDIENNKNYCLGDGLIVKVNTSGAFDQGNKFILQMSDTMGSFSNPILSDTISSSQDSFLYQIPNTLPPNSNYRLKIISTSPYLTQREEISIGFVEKPGVNFLVDDTTLCVNDTFVFTNTSIKNTANTLYSWRFGDSSFSTTTNSTHSYKAPGKYQVLLNASSGNCSDSKRKDVIVFDNPKSKFYVNDSQQCYNNQLFEFSDSSISQAGDSINTYKWSFGDLNQSSLQNPTHSYSKEGTYEVELIVSTLNACSDTSKISVVVLPSPEIDTVLGPTIVRMQDTSTYTIITDTFTTYFWFVDYGVLTHGIDSSNADIIWDSVPTFTNAIIKIFPINVVGCFGDTAYLDIQISPFPIGIPELRVEKIKVFPNPANSSLFIEFEKEVTEPRRVRLVDIVGREVISKIFTTSGRVLELNISAIESGNYHLIIESNNSISKSKVTLSNK
jgi:PKD repeat protein